MTNTEDKAAIARLDADIWDVHNHIGFVLANPNRHDRARKLGDAANQLEALAARLRGKPNEVQELRDENKRLKDQINAKTLGNTV